MSTRTAAFEKAKANIVNNSKYQEGKNKFMSSSIARMERKNIKEEKKAKESAEQSKKKSGFLSRLFSRKPSKGGKKNRKTKRKNKKC